MNNLNICGIKNTLSILFFFFLQIPTLTSHRIVNVHNVHSLPLYLTDIQQGCWCSLGSWNLSKGLKLFHSLKYYLFQAAHELHINTRKQTCIHTYTIIVPGFFSQTMCYCPKTHYVQTYPGIVSKSSEFS